MAAVGEEDLDIPLEESPSLVGGVEPQILFDESYRNAYRNRGESQCRVVWHTGHRYFTCSTCGLDPHSAICYGCLRLGNHKGHDVDAIFGASSSKPSFSPSTTSCYYSARIQSMIENRSKFTSDVEFEIENSKVHWSEIDSTPTIENFGEQNRASFLALKKKYCPHWSIGNFFTERDDIVIGKKIGEGGQAEIYEVDKDYVVKVFHPSLRLEDLENQWPKGMLKEFHSPFITYGRHFLLIQGGILLKDCRFLDRFGILMERHWGDLRKLIDLRMVEGNNQGPPFSVCQVRRLMFCIAQDMQLLHSAWPRILHRDLKASNVLVLGLERPSINGKILATVADFECSVGVVGTGFWRAPEILEHLKNQVQSSAMKFFEESDVYSFGMVCYELVTGCIPFEDRSTRDYDFILDGNQPELPADLHPLLKSVIVDCWHADPYMRPSFQDIIAKLNEF